VTHADLLAKQQQRLCDLLARHREVRFAYLHGSAAEGLPYHDLDVALYLDPNHPDAQDPFEYETRLSVDLTLSLGFPVDVHVLNTAPLGFQHSAVQGRLLMARDDEQLADYLESVTLRYTEFAPLSRAYLMEVLTE